MIKRKKRHSFFSILLTVFMVLSSMMPVGLPIAASDTVNGTVNQLSIAGAVYSPTWPSGKLSVSNLNLNSLTLSWSGAADDVGVTGYNIYQDGTLIAGNTNFNPFSVNGLQPGTQYTFTVQALNAAGLESTDGPSVTVTTHIPGEKIIANAVTDTIYFDYTHQNPVTTGGLDTWVINVPNATLKAGAGYNDLIIGNTPNGMYYRTTRLDDHNLAFGFNGNASTPLTMPYTVTVSVEASAVTDPDLLDSDPIQLLIKEVTSVSLNKSIDTLSKGNSDQLIATVIPVNTPDKTVTWTTSDSSIATVDSTGKVTAVGPGTATITSQVVSGLTATCAFTVTPGINETPVPVESLYTDHVGKKLTVRFGKDIADPTGNLGQFTVKVNGTAVSVTKAAYGPNPNEIVLSLASTAGSGATVLLSYAKGTLAAADGSLVDSFTDYAVTNNYVIGGVVGFSPDATELSYDAINQVIKLRYDNPVDYNNVTSMTWNFSNAFGRNGDMFIPDLTNYVKLYEKDTGTAVVLPLVAVSALGREWGQTDDWYYTRSGQGVTVGLNLTTCALKPNTTYVIDILKGFAYNNGTTNSITDSFEFTTTATSSSKPVWPAGSLTVTNPAGPSATLNWPLAQYHPAYPAGWASGYNKGVTGYNIYQDGTLLTTVAGTDTSYQLNNLTPGNSYQFSVKAVDLAGQLSDPLTADYNAALLTPPVVTADEPNQAGSAVNLTFIDNAVWRSAITGITVDGALLEPIQYTVTAGNISIAPGVLNTDANHSIVISATSYQDTTVVQSTVTTAPTLTANEILPGGAVDLTFTDNAAWRAAISGITVNDAVYLTSGQYVITAGHIYIVAGILNTTGDHTIAVSATGYADTTVTQKVVDKLTPPVLTAKETFPNIVVDLTFTDNAAWRSAITGVKVDGTALTNGQYVVTAGHLKFAASVFTTTGSHTIAVSATNYNDAIVTQHISAALTPPALTSDSANYLPGTAVNITFTDDELWRAAISGVAVNGIALTSSQYTVTAGKLSIAANILNSVGNHTITVSATQYADTSVTQVIHLITRFDSLSDGTITTVAGIGGSSNAGYSGDNGPATGAKLNQPFGLTIDSNSGAIYIADGNNNRIRKVDLSGTITTVAGTGTSGYSGDNGPATSANIRFPNDIKVDGSGNIYFTDTNNHRVRKVDTNGIITTVAGSGTSGYTGDDGPATSARIKSPRALALDAAGNLYFGDSGNYRIRKVDTSGTITTVAGNGTSGYSGDNGPATQAQLSSSLYGLTLDAAGNLYIGDRQNYRVRKVDLSTGVITTVAGNGKSGYAGDGGPATLASLSASGLSFDPAGNLYINDTSNNAVRRVDAGGTITTIAGTGTYGFSGDGGPATQAKLNGPIEGVFYDSNEGGLYIGDTYNNCVRFVKLKPVAAMPNPSIPSGGYANGTTVSLSTATAGAAIYYTMDISTPTSASTPYSGPITLNLTGGSATTIKAVAVKAGLADSAVMTASYTLPDNAPTWPANPTATASTITDTGLTLTWTPALDNVGVTGYQIYDNDTLMATVTSATYNLTGLTAGTSYVFKVKAGNASGGWSDYSPATLTVKTLPSLTAKGTDNVPGKAVDLTFTDDPAWRAAITGVTLDGTALTSNPYTGYTISEGKINIAALAWKTTGDHTIVVKATNYGDNTVTQTINTALTPPVLTPDSVHSTVGQGVFITFTDNAAWRAAITGVKINGVALTGGQYTIIPGIIYIDPSALPALPGYCTVAVSATNYADAVATQIIYQTTPGVAAVNPALQSLAEGYITTVAGQGGQSGNTGDGGPALSAKFNEPRSTVVDAVGNIYIADRNNYRVRKVDVNGNITTVAGNGQLGDTVFGGPATQTHIYAEALDIDSKGNLYLVDNHHPQYRYISKVDPSGIITSFVSSGFNYPVNITVDSSDNLYIADLTGTQYGISMTAGNIYTIAGNGTNSNTGDGGPATQASLSYPGGLTLDSEGNLYIATNGSFIRRVDKSGIISTVAGTGTPGYSGDGGPALQAMISAGHPNYEQNAGGIYMAGNSCVRFIKMKPAVAALSANLPDGAAVTGNVVSLKSAASITLSTLTSGADIYYTTDGSTPTTASTKYTGPIAISGNTTLKAIGSKAGLADSLVLTRYYQLGNTVPPVLTTVSADTYLGDAVNITFTDDPAWRAALINVSLDGTALTNSNYTLTAGSLTLPASDFMVCGNHTLAISAMGYQDATLTLVMKVKTNIPDGYINIFAGIPGKIGAYSGDGGPATSAQLSGAYSAVADSAGNVYIIEYGNNRVRKVDPSGTITTVAGTGNRYPTTIGVNNIPALQATLGNPGDIAVDGMGNIYVPDTDSHSIREISMTDHTQWGIDMKAGYIYTVAGSGAYNTSGDGGPATSAGINNPSPVAFDQSGNLYFMGEGGRVREVAASDHTQWGIDMKAGYVYTVAGNGNAGYSGDGGPATSAQIGYGPVCVDSAGNLYIGDMYSLFRIRKVDASGIITTIAGTGTSGYSGDGGPAKDAQITGCSDLTVDAAGNLYFTNAYRVRMIDTSGNISTIAGNGTRGYSGDGGPATSASLYGCNGLNYSAQAGGLYYTDNGQYYNDVRFIKLAAATVAPQLTADSTDNTVGYPVELTFTDNQAWRSRITDVTVDGKSIAGKYTVAGGKITIESSVFDSVKQYNIAVKASGYADATVIQPVVVAAYTITPVADAAYQTSTASGITTMTINAGVNGLKFLNVQTGVVRSHLGHESVVFVHTRSGVQISLNISRADFDTVKEAQAGFNVKPGDVIKVFMVDVLTNDLNFNPTILQQ
ncbi:MAG: Chitinase D precursor [Pelotomaculum sp. PtaB.Bin104]|nr:MAG: Chitinase D precursor [Pelotomaculum sp. PtaB.Bin104]